MDCDFNTIIKKLEDMHINSSDEEECELEPDQLKFNKITKNSLSEEKCEIKLLKSKMFLMQEANKDKCFKMNKDLKECEVLVKEKDETLVELNKTIGELKRKAQNQEEDESKRRKQQMELIKDYYEEKMNSLKKEKDSYIKHLENELLDSLNSKSSALEEELERVRNYNRSYKDKNFVLLSKIEALEDQIKQKDSNYRELKNDLKSRVNEKNQLFKHSSCEFSKHGEMKREFKTDLQSREKVYTHIRDISPENEDRISSVKKRISYHEEQIMAQTRRRNELLASDSSEVIEEYESEEYGDEEYESEEYGDGEYEDEECEDEEYEDEEYEGYEDEEYEEEKEFEDEEERKLFVGGLPMETTKKAILKHFLTYGDIDRIVFKTDVFGKSRGFAFVVFKYLESLSSALQVKDHKILQCKVTVAKAYGKNASKTGKIFVANLDPNLTDHEIQQHFEKFGEILDFKHPYDHAKNRRKACCFITFKNKRDANDLIRLGSTNINGVDLVIERVVNNKSLTGRAVDGLTRYDGLTRVDGLKRYDGRNWSGADTGLYGNDRSSPSTLYAFDSMRSATTGFQCNDYCVPGCCDNNCFGYDTFAATGFYV